MASPSFITMERVPLACMHTCVCAFVCCVCVRERERDRERHTQREREREKETFCLLHAQGGALFQVTAFEGPSAEILSHQLLAFA